MKPNQTNFLPNIALLPLRWALKLATLEFTQLIAQA
jgi:hypothetical protein